MQHIEVAPLTIVRADQATMTYLADPAVSIGSIVHIPVGKKQMLGVVMATAKKPAYDVREISGALDLPPLPIELLHTAKWISSYYMVHLSVVLRSILPTGILAKRRHAKEKVLIPQRKRTNIVFTKDQSDAIKAIAHMNSGSALLHGITGSGKTAVYIELAKQTLRSNKSIVILVPEIALTSQLVAEFSNHFDDVILTHSKQTEAERHRAWLEALNSQTPRIVIGPRSALFMPLKTIGLVVIDECHEPSYKQEQQPRYSALRTASTLALQHDAKLILGSATPLVSDYYIAKTTDRPIITMHRTAQPGAVKPTVQIIDMTKRGNFTQHRFLSDALLDQIKSQPAGEQTLLFHNRRGTASTTLCENCGWQAGCPRCFIPLTLHADSHKLICHICGTTTKVPTSCPECNHSDIIHKGIGTKLIESEIRRLFPNKTIARFDGDSESSATLDKRYQELYDGKIDIIIGTQVLAKGLDMPHLRTVGVVQADAGLALPDFATPERTFQLLSQVIGRVGRSHHPTNVIVQSYQPANPAIVDGIAQNYDDFYARTLKLRAHTNFPPFCYLLKLVCVYKTESAAIKNSRALAEKLAREFKNIEVLGPTPAFYERIGDTYRWQIVVKAKRRQDLIAALKHLPPKNWQFELDPSSLL